MGVHNFKQVVRKGLTGEVREDKTRKQGSEHSAKAEALRPECSRSSRQGEHGRCAESQGRVPAEDGRAMAGGRSAAACSPQCRVRFLA